MHSLYLPYVLHEQPVLFCIALIILREKYKLQSLHWSAILPVISPSFFPNTVLKHPESIFFPLKLRILILQTLQQIIVFTILIVCLIDNHLYKLLNKDT